MVLPSSQEKCRWGGRTRPSPQVFGFKRDIRNLFGFSNQIRGYFGFSAEIWDFFGSGLYRPKKRRDSMHSSDPTGTKAVTTLDRLEPGCRCHVVGVRASGSLRKRVLAMGMVPGAEVEVLQAAPLGDPTEYRVKGYCLSFRRAEASLIEVVPEEGA